MKQSLIVTLCCVATYATHVAAEKQEFNFDDTQSIVVKVSETGLTRLSVQGDRLREVIGLDDTVVVDKDEANGHLFLKGVRTKQTITVVTEGGNLQDLTLIPGTKGSTSILLKQDGQTAKTDRAHTPHTPLSFGTPFHPEMNPGQANSLANNIMGIMRYVFAGHGTLCEKSTTRTARTGLEAVSTHQYRAQTLVGDVYTVKNTHECPTAICEKDFYHAGDLALAFSKKELEPGETATLFVIRNGV